jgi:hypothetical protein
MEGGDDAVTIDLNGHLAVRSKNEAGRVTEIALPQSTVIGPAARFRICRPNLLRALELGFTAFQIVDDKSPLVCEDERRTYLWMPIGREGALGPSDDAARITPPIEGSEPTPNTSEGRQRRMTSKGTANGHASNGEANGHAANGTSGKAKANGTSNGHAGKTKQSTSGGLAALIDDAQSIREIVRDCCKRANRLVIALKRHRRQSKLLAGTVAALRQLQTIDS